MNAIVLIFLWVLGTLTITSVAAIIAKRYGPEYLIGMYASSIVIAAIIANKLVVVGPFIVSAAIIVYSVTFFLTDTISEFWGKEMATKAVWAGFLADVLLIFAVWVAIQWEPAAFWQGQEAFVQTLGLTARIAIASLIAFILAQNHDVWAFHFWKNKFQGKHLWIRNNASTGMSQIIDTVIFVTIAFYGIVPIAPVILGSIAVKLIVAILDTPFIYVVRWYFEKVPPYKKSFPAL